MSADRQRLTSAIRRIAKTDPEIRGLLDAADNKGGKPGSAGVGSSTDAESQRICCDGSVSSNPNPGTEERDPDSSAQSGLDSTDPADLTSGEGTLSGVTDCATGEPICFDGDGFIPPDGWDSPTDPPIDPDWVPDPNYFWKGVLSLSGEWRTKGEAKAAIKARVADEGLEFCGFNTDSETSVSTTSYEVCETQQFPRIIVTANRQSCSTFPSSIWCQNDGYGDPTEEEQREDAWPSDSCVNLSIKGGKIVGSKYDPENDGSYSAPRDSIDLCDGNGNQISLAPASNGGWKTINSTNDNGYLYDSSGKQIAHIDGNEYSDPSV